MASDHMIIPPNLLCCFPIGHAPWSHDLCGPITAKYLVSCEEARMLNPTLTTKDIIIDLDDSGPLDPFPVTCVFQRKC